MTLTVGDLDESELLDRILPLLPRGHRTVTGPGDDAAVLNVPSGQLVISTDVLVEGHHFRTDWSSAEDVGYRAAVQNLADIAAMGANPTAMVVGLVLPPATPVAWVEGLARGLAEATEPAGVGVIGGDLVAGEQLVVAVTVHGETFAHPILRSGAEAGDIVAVAGTLGYSAAGFALQAAGIDGDADTDVFLRNFRRPQPPLSAGMAAVSAGATAMMDISDGLARDATRLAKASGVTVEVNSDLIADDVRDLAPAARALGTDDVGMSWVVTGGEDHGLLATFPPDAELPEEFRPIGVVVAKGAEPFLVDGAVPTQVGWDHFKR